MITFNGERLFRISLSQSFEYLGDASFLVQSQPDSEIVSLSQDRAVWKLKPHFSFIRSSLETTLTIIKRIPESSIGIEIFSQGIGASSNVSIALGLTSSDEFTKVQWNSEITALTGLLKMVPKGLIQSSAQKVIEETWLNIEKRIDSLHPNAS